MRTRQARRLPSELLMTDERIGEGLWRAIDRLPRGGAIIFRHYSLPAPDRRTLFDRVRRVARRRGLLLILAGSPQLAVAWKADGTHGHSRHRRAVKPLICTAPAHDRRQLIAARRSRAALILVSPVYQTRSHPNGRSLGRVKLGLLVGRSRHDVAALGGMSHRRARALRLMGITRWAAIDAWSQ